MEKVKNPLFKDIDHIQTIIKHSTGIGDPLIINFKAPINTKESEIEYIKTYPPFVNELDLLRHEKYKEYAKHQCSKMCHFLQKQRGIEILSMSAEFLIDDVKNIWFSNASEIKYRNGNKKVTYEEYEGTMHSEAHTKLEQAQL